MKRTTGRYDPAERGPRYFLASNTDTLEMSEAPHLLIAVDQVGGSTARERFERLLEGSESVLLDSGIYALTQAHARAHRVSMDQALSLAPDEVDGFADLWRDYSEIVSTYRDRLWGIIELDQGGAERKRVTRARIEDELGVVPMPVYHPVLDGWDYLEELAEGYDRVCFGNVVEAHPGDRKRLLHTAFERQRASFPETWLHLLGYTLSEDYLMAPWHGSCDSSSWTRNVRWAASDRSFSLGRRLSTMQFATRYEFASDAHGDRGYRKAGLLAGIREGLFLPDEVGAYLRRREALA